MYGVSKHDFERIYSLMKRAMAEGAKKVSPSCIEWDISKGCHEPYFQEIGGHIPPVASDWKNPGIATWNPGEQHPLYIRMWVPCRQCIVCLKHRARLWSFRAQHEIRTSSRTWFGTLTASASNHYLLDLRAGLSLKEGRTFEELSPTEQFRCRCTEFGKEVTKFFKRVRKNTGAPIRYLTVFERHKSGLPHVHMLIHEASQPVTYRDVSNQWKLGHSHFKLVDRSETKTAWYVAKYLSKESAARVRASLGYGETMERNSRIAEAYELFS